MPEVDNLGFMLVTVYMFGVVVVGVCGLDFVCDLYFIC